MKIKSSRLCCFSLLLAGSSLFAQTSPGFEVASVRLIQPSQEEVVAQLHENIRQAGANHRLPSRTSVAPLVSGSHVDSDGIALIDLVALAYGEDIEKISGPGYLNARYVIHALMPEGATREQIPNMFRALLEDRFHLVIQHDTSAKNGYALVPDKAGPKLAKPGEIDESACENWIVGRPPANVRSCLEQRIIGNKKIQITIKSDSKYGPWESWLSDNIFRTEFFNITLAQLAVYLTAKLSSPGSNGLYVPVVDNSGIQGTWDVVLDKVVADPATITFNADDAMSSFSSALAKVGLKLEHTRTSAEKLVVVSGTQLPTEN